VVESEGLFDEMIGHRAVRAGWPDRAVLHNGTLVGIEIKQGLSPISSSQKEIAKMFWGAGWPYLLVRYMRHARYSWSFSIAQYDDTLKRKFRGLTLNQFIQLLGIEGVNQSLFEQIELSGRGQKLVYGPMYQIPVKEIQGGITWKRPKSTDLTDQ